MISEEVNDEESIRVRPEDGSSPCSHLWKRKEKREAGGRMRGGRFGAVEEKEEKEKEEEPSKSKRRPERVKKKKLIRKENERLGGIGKKKD